jgi:hypothetical protein
VQGPEFFGDLQYHQKKKKKKSKHLSPHFSKEDTKMANKHMKRHLPCPVSKDMQIESLMRYHFTAISMAEIKN